MPLEGPFWSSSGAVRFLGEKAPAEKKDLDYALIALLIVALVILSAWFGFLCPHHW
jgi:hypothetical protein